MTVEFKLPDLGEGIHEAEIIEVLVSVGDTVADGQPIMVLETDKAATEVPAPVSGVVQEIRFKAGDMVQVGDVLMVFQEEGEPVEQAVKTEEIPKAVGENNTAKIPEAEPATRSEKPLKKSQKSSRASEGPVPAAPSTRRLARELNVDLSAVTPSGPGGRVMPEDVNAHAEKARGKTEPPVTPEARRPAPAAERPQLPDFSRWGPVERIPLRSIRRATANRMMQAWKQIPHVTHQDTADITDLETFRLQNKAEIEAAGGALTLTVFALKAAAAVLKVYPYFNASFDAEAGEIVLKKYYHIGVAIDTDRGLIVPVIRDADCKSITDIAKELPELARRTRSGEVDPSEIGGGTFTLTNIGALGGTGFVPMINYPQAAILGLARARLQPVIQGDREHFEVTARLLVPVCIAFDHRLIDGADAARFLNEIVTLLQNPKKLMMR